MNQAIAKGLGWLSILIGVLGFLGFAGGTIAMGPPGNLLGAFPVNLLHNVAHILIGIWGVNAARSSAGATAFCKQNPKADTVPMSATGHDTIYFFSCSNGRAKIKEQNWKVDRRGFGVELWKPMD